jgi:hypothetical protein
MHRSRRMKSFLLAAGAMLALAAPGSAPGAVTIGATFTASEPLAASPTFIQSRSSGNAYAAPSDGVITSWAHQADASPPTLRFKVVHPLGGNSFGLVGESGLTPQAAGVLNRFPIRIPVQAGDVIGFFLAGSGSYKVAAQGSAGGDQARFVSGDAPSGATLYSISIEPIKLDISAQLEPDADHDGFGDETQDLCPSDASTQGPCPDTDRPETWITRRAPNKTAKTTVKFRFRSDEAGSKFECRLDKQVWKWCSSPYKVTSLHPGKHNFKVRAIDAAGNVDHSPARDRFKVVG